MMMRTSSALLLLVALSATRTVQSSIQDMNVMLPATQEYVQYADGYIRGPGGVIDLSGLQFQVVSTTTSAFDTEEAEYYEEGDGDDLIEEYLEEELEEQEEEEEEEEKQEEYDDEEAMDNENNDVAEEKKEQKDAIEEEIIEKEDEALQQAAIQEGAKENNDWKQKGNGNNKNKDEHQFDENNNNEEQNFEDSKNNDNQVEQFEEDNNINQVENNNDMEKEYENGDNEDINGELEEWEEDINNVDEKEENDESKFNNNNNNKAQNNNNNEGSNNNNNNNNNKAQNNNNNEGSNNNNNNNNNNKESNFNDNNNKAQNNNNNKNEEENEFNDEVAEQMQQDAEAEQEMTEIEQVDEDTEEVFDVSELDEEEKEEMEELEEEIFEESEQEEDENDEYDEDGFGGRFRRHRRLEEGGSSVVDIVVFPFPYKCVKKGCDWSELGVGMKSGSDDDSELRWCCSDETIELGLCKQKDFGKLLIDESKFQGQHRTVGIPKDGENTVMSLGEQGVIQEDDSGRYVVLFANCNEAFGHRVMVSGSAVWKSSHGYLPGELYGFYLFFVVLAVVYVILYVWYNYLMKKHEAHRVEIEKWIRTVIALGCTEMLFRTLDYFVWNTTGHRSEVVIWISVLTGNFKQGFSRCLLVMVSMGWGIVRDSLGSSMKPIVFMGIAYIATSAAIDFLVIMAIESVNVMAYKNEAKLLDAVTVLQWVRICIDTIFILWILEALKSTMVYLEKMNQQRKLERTRQLRSIFFIAVGMAALVSLFLLADNVKDDGIVQEEQAWAKDALTELVYLFLLVSIAVLWRPNPAAKEYAYAMELPNFGDDDDDMNHMDFVPSATDDIEEFVIS